MRNQAIRAFARLYPFERGRFRLSRYLVPLRSGHGRVIVSDRTIALNLDHYVDALLYLFADYEKDEIRTLAALSREIDSSIFLDIGAHIGLFTIALSSGMREVHAFEPHPDNFRRLTENVSGLAHVRCHEVAISDGAGDVALHAPVRDTHVDFGKFNAGAHTLEPTPGGSGTFMTVRRGRLDDLLAFHGRRLTMKVDVEGHELPALRGATDTLSNNRCVVMVESFPDRRTSVFRFLTDLGYRHRHSHRENHFFENSLQVP